MSKQKLLAKQELEITDAITGFSLSFSRVLLAKLEKLMDEDKVYVAGIDNIGVKTGSWVSEQVTPIAGTTIRYLGQQMLHFLGDTDSPLVLEEELRSLIQLAREFLSIFK